jgi:ribosome biogenesis GTPase A
VLGCAVTLRAHRLAGIDIAVRRALSSATILQATSPPPPCAVRGKDHMAISWYPAHMATARKEAAETMRRIDLVIEMLDARVPHSSCNPVFEGLRRQGQRPALKLLNKADAADPTETQRWLEHYDAQPGVKAIAVCAKNPSEASRIPRACQELLPERGTSAKPLRMMILGIPNVGKSTLMNALLRRHLAHVGDEPAITKTQMCHKLGPGMSLVDTPGMLWPGLAQSAALKLAATHSIGRAAYDDEEVAVELGGYLISRYPHLVAERFGELSDSCDGHGLLHLIATRRCLARKAGGPDIARAAVALLNDFRSGALGRITLEPLPSGRP